MCSSATETGANIKSVKIVEDINANGVFYKFEGNDLIEIILDVYFPAGFIADPNLSGDNLKSSLYKKIKRGAHVICDGREVKPSYGYWPQETSNTSAKKMTLYYVVPQNRTGKNLTFVYDGSVLGIDVPDLRKMIKFSASGGKPGDQLNTESFEVTPINQGKAKEETLVFNGAPVDITRDNVKTMTLKSDASFTDKLGRKLIIQDFEYDKIRNKYIVNAKMVLDKGQSSTFNYSKACRGLTDAPKTQHSRTPDSSDGAFTLEEKRNPFSENQYIFTTTEGYVTHGVSFDVDDAVTGDLEGNMSFDYMTKGATARIANTIRIGECD
jgi:hypothetical protein